MCRRIGWPYSAMGLLILQPREDSVAFLKVFFFHYMQRKSNIYVQFSQYIFSLNIALNWLFKGPERELRNALHYSVATFSTTARILMHFYWFYHYFARKSNISVQFSICLNTALIRLSWCPERKLRERASVQCCHIFKPRENFDAFLLAVSLYCKKKQYFSAVLSIYLVLT